MWNGSCSSCKRSADGFTDVQTMIGQSLIPLRVTGRSLVAWQNVACLFEHGHLLYARNACETAHTHTLVRSHEQTFTAERQRYCGVIEERDCLSVSAGIWGSTGDQGLKEAFRFRDWTERKATDLRLFRARELCLHPGFRCSWHLSVWQCKANLKIKISSLCYLMSSGPLVFQVETLLFIQSVPGG